jgi:hypothetical protein
MDYARAFIDWAAREDDATFAAWSSALMLEPEQAQMVQQCVAYTLMRGKFKDGDAYRLHTMPERGAATIALASRWGTSAKVAGQWLRDQRRLGRVLCRRVSGSQLWFRT